MNDRLQCEAFPNVYAVGDSALLVDHGRACAPTAQLACQMGDYVADLFCGKLAGREIAYPFAFRRRGTVCSIGGCDGVGEVYGCGIKGGFAAFMKSMIENKWLMGLGGVRMVLKKGQFRYRTSS